MKKFLPLIVLSFIFTIISGCATVAKPIQYSGLKKPSANVGILVSEPVKATTTYTGRIGLLDYAIIAGANSSLDDHLEALAFDDYLKLPIEVQKIANAQGYNAVILDKSVSLEEAKKFKNHKEGISQNNYALYTNTGESLDYLLTLRLMALGTTRPYYGPVPTAAPVTQAVLWGELVDLSNNNVVWYNTISTTKVIPEPWDEKANGYPNLTNAVYQALNDAMEQVKEELNSPKEIDEASEDKVALNQ